MIYILIVFLAGPYAGTFSSVEFNSLEACEKTAKRIKLDDYAHHTLAFCAEKK